MKEESNSKSKGLLIAILKLFTGTISLIYFLFGIVLISACAFLFGWLILHDPMSGNDAAFALSQATWIERYFPNIPFWYPLQGAGISILGGYPVFFTIVSVIVHRLAAITLIQSFGLIQFSTLIITSVGIYLFVWSRFKSQIMALLASILYFLSPMTYVWIIGAGFYAQTFSFMFVPYALLFYDLYLDTVLSAVIGARRRIFFVLAVVFLALTTFGHPATGIGCFIVFGVYSFLCSLLYKGKDKVNRAKKAVLAYLVFASVTLLLILFWLFPLQRYTGMTGRGFNPSDKANLEIVAQFNLPGTLGL